MLTFSRELATVQHGQSFMTADASKVNARAVSRKVSRHNQDLQLDHLNKLQGLQGVEVRAPPHSFGCVLTAQHDRAEMS
jgi:hypothetical protein